MSIEKGRPSRIESVKVKTPDKKGFSALTNRAKESARRMGKNLKKLRLTAHAGLKYLGGNRENPLITATQEMGRKKRSREFKGSLAKWAKGSERAQKFRNNFKEARTKVQEKAVEFIGSQNERLKEGRKRGMEKVRKRAKEFGEDAKGEYKNWRKRRNKNKILKNIEGSKLEKGKHEGKDRWKNAAENYKEDKLLDKDIRRFKRVRLTPEADAFAKKNSEEVQARRKEIDRDYKKRSRRERSKNLARAVDDVFRKKNGESASQMIDRIKKTPEHQAELQSRIDLKDIERHGAGAFEFQKRRIENQLLAEEVNNKLKSQRNKTKNQEGSEKPKPPSEKRPEARPNNQPPIEQKPKAKEGEKGENKDKELTPEQKAMKKGIELVAKLNKLGFDPESPGGQDLINELIKNPDQMQKLGEIADRINASKTANGPEAASKTAQAEKESLEQQIEAAEEAGDEKKSSFLKSMLRVLFASAVGATKGLGEAIKEGYEEKMEDLKEYSQEPSDQAGPQGNEASQDKEAEERAARENEAQKAREKASQSETPPNNETTAT